MMTIYIVWEVFSSWENVFIKAFEDADEAAEFVRKGNEQDDDCHMPYSTLTITTGTLILKSNPS